MIELPEAVTLAGQLSCLFGKKIVKVIAAQSPHKFAWYSGDPGLYESRLKGKSFESASGFGSMVELMAGNIALVLSEGVKLAFIEDETNIPKKHQMLVTFEDGSMLCANVQMYGGLLCNVQSKLDNDYYLIAKKKPSPLSKEFSKSYFDSILSGNKMGKLSVKAALATEQRIPGLGNGVLQDILFNAKVHPKKKMNTLSADDISILFDSVKSTLKEMADKGGRDTEKDLFGNPGGYKTVLCKYTLGRPCPVCGTLIQKASYMGGSIYFCETCQVL